jgi:hypothetical protein
MIPQHTWVTKLFGYDLSVEYRPRKLNTVADALSRCDADSSDLVARALSGLTFTIYDNLRAEIQRDPQAQALLEQVSAAWLDLGGRAAAVWRPPFCP